MTGTIENLLNEIHLCNVKIVFTDLVIILVEDQYFKTYYVTRKH